MSVAADRSGRPAHLLEKDVWVVWALATLYGSPLGEHLVFKGGTSLSKAYGVIRRFSEDVDLTYDIRALAPDLVGDGWRSAAERPEARRSAGPARSEAPAGMGSGIGAADHRASAWRSRAGAAIRVEGDKLFIDYEPTSAGSGYVAPSVMLEFGARSTGEPASVRDVTCDASGLVEGVESSDGRPRVMHAERPSGKRRPPSTYSACRSGSAEIASRVTGMTSCGSMRPASRLPLLRTATWRRPLRDTRRCSSRRRLPTGRLSTMPPPSTAASSWFRPAKR